MWTVISKVVVLLCIVKLSWCTSIDQNANEDYYIAGAVEYSPELTKVSPESNIENNLKAYLELIDLAKHKNVDILVFPEATLNYYGLPNRKALLDNALSVPNPENKIAPCDHVGNYSEVLALISKAAKDNRIYILINIVEKVPCSTSPNSCSIPYNTHHDHYSLYNANIVFDRYGRIISRYRKINLFVEPHMDEPLTEPLSTFRTDFNVKFGHFICFDIMFKEPSMSMIKQANVTNILYPSMWFSYLPFLTAEQFHQGWAFTNNINLISAGASNPRSGSTGSGIYLGRKGIPDIVMSPKPIRKLYTDKVPKDNTIQNKLSQITTRDQYSPTEMLNLHLTELWADEGASMFDIENRSQTICAYDNICCTFEIMKKDSPVPPGKLAYRYALAVNYTTKLYGRTREVGELNCAVVSCTGNSPKTCGRRFKNDNIIQLTVFDQIKIKAKIRSNSFEDILIIPNTLNSGILPFDTTEYNFDSTEVYKDSKHHYRDFTIESRNKLPDFLTFGIYGRDFRLDRKISVRGTQSG